ncbi:MAG: hypothetical protein LLG04_01255 [Parachlamydia sp.]|nr:hypothetical protein [Parachlamydia sp.]
MDDKHVKKDVALYDIVEAAIYGALMGQISSIPILGGAVTGALDRTQQIRADEFLQSLYDKIACIGNEKVDKNFLRTEECADLFLHAIRVRMRHRSQQKAKFIVGLMTESVLIERDPRFTVNLKESFLNLIDQLTDDDLYFLKEFREGKYMKMNKDDVYSKLDQKAVSLDHLMALGIISEESTWQKHITLTMRGREFYDYLEIIARI